MMDGEDCGLDLVTKSGWSLRFWIWSAARGPPSALLSLDAVKQVTPGRKFQKDLPSQCLMGKCPTVGWKGDFLGDRRL